MLYEFITQGCCTFAARPHRSFVAFRPFGEVSSVIRGLVCLTHLPHRRHRLLVCQTHQPLFGTCHSPWATLQARPAPGPHQARTRPAPGPHQARTRPAPGPHQARARPAPGPRQARTRVFSEVERLLQCDSLDLTLGLTDFAGQKQDLRTMEPVAEIIGHCFVVGD